MAPVIVKAVAEGRARHAEEVARREVEHQRRQREEAERRRIQNIQDSRTDLLATIESWHRARGIQAFLDSLATQVAALPEPSRAYLGERLRLARDLIGDVDPLERLRTWRAPAER